MLSLEQENSINSNDIGTLASLDEDLLFNCKSSSDIDEIQSTSTTSSVSDSNNWISPPTDEAEEYVHF